MGLFDSDNKDRIIHAISLAENRTSGEIRVAVEKTCESNPIERATFYFHSLEMHKTALRNGVLIYVATEDHKFAIIGDQGIHMRVGEKFWDSTKELMLEKFKKGDLTGGVISGIENAGEQLKRFFPVAKDDINELPNDIFYGD